MENYDVIIIGGGIVGCCLARELSRYRLNILLLEKEPDVCEGISKANSGVLHAGFNVEPGSLKARLNLEGLYLCYQAARELDVPVRNCEKLVVARTVEEEPYLDKLLAQGKRNGCRGLTLLDQGGIEAREPLIRGRKALLSRTTGIINPFLFTIASAENAAANGAVFALGRRVAAIGCGKGSRPFTVESDTGESFGARCIINAAGIGAYRIASLLGEKAPPVYPYRGEYYVVDKRAAGLIKRAVYPVPPRDGRGLGVHLTPTTNGNILIGPSADYIEDGDDRRTTRAVMDTLKQEAYGLLPELKGYPFIKNYAGMRPKLFAPGSGQRFADFHIRDARDFPGFVNLLGIESPGLTSAPAIARYVTEEIVSRRIRLEPNVAFTPFRRGIPRTAHMKSEERKALIRRNPDFADIFCRCEEVSQGEIDLALENPLGVRTLNGIKKRTYAMMGRCQSGFCLPRLAELLLQEKGIKPELFRYNGPGTELLQDTRDRVDEKA